MNVDGKTGFYCIIGDPVEHSLSPLIHNHSFFWTGANGVYAALKVTDLKKAVEGLKAVGVKGFNVTIPHKINVMKYLDKIDETANAVGAVNTVVNNNGILVGYNTDCDGALEAIKAKVGSLKGKRAVILGSGGAARAVNYGLIKNNVETIVLKRSDIEKKEHLKLLPKIDIICNCTPVGMNEEQSLIPKEFLNNHIVFDAVYAKRGTKLIRDSLDKKCVSIGGDEMLVNQAVKAFQLWTGRKMDSDILEGLVKEKLEMQRNQSNIYITGFMGTGKTSVGRALSEKLKMNFVDTDEEIERISGTSIEKIFSDFGEVRFRELESEVLNLVSKKQGCVASVGGGAVLNSLNVLRMKNTGTVVLLEAGVETIIKRLERDSSRPLLKGDEKEKRIASLLEARKPFYNLAGGFKIKSEGSVDSIVGEISRVVGNG